MTNKDLNKLKRLDHSYNKKAFNIVLNDYNRVKEKSYKFYDYENYRQFILDFNEFYNNEQIENESLLNYSHIIYKNKLSAISTSLNPSFTKNNVKAYRIDTIYDLFKFNFINQYTNDLYYVFINKIFNNLSYIITIDDFVYFYTINEQDIIDINKNIISIKQIKNNLLKEMINILNNSIEKIIRNETTYYIKNNLNLWK